MSAPNRRPRSSRARQCSVVYGELARKAGAKPRPHFPVPQLAGTVGPMPMTTTIPSDMPLRDMLEHRRLALRDRRLAHVIVALRIRAEAYESAPRSLLDAIAGFSAEQAALRRRLGEIERAARPDGAAHGRARA
jgi:hypothetical protein